MTVTTELASAVFTWTGVETSFSCGFPADKVADLRVVFRNAAGTDFVLALGVNYTATLANTTKLVTITPVTIPGVAGKVIVTRRTPALVPEVLLDGQQFSLAVVQAMHDKAAMRSAEDRERLGRALVLKEGQALGDGNFNLGGSGIDNGAPGLLSTSFVTRGQLQDLVAAVGNLPLPLTDQIDYVLRVIAEGVYGWRQFYEVPVPGAPDVDKALIATAPGVYAWMDRLAGAVRYAAAQALTDPQKTQARSNIAAAASDQVGYRNLLINAGFRVNQRGFAGGALSAGSYGHDRWKGGAGGANYSVAGAVATISSGSIVQVVEGASIEQGGTYTINWTGTAICSVDGVAKTKGAPVTLTAGANVLVEFSAGTVSFAQLEPGATASPFAFRPIADEIALCQRYFEVITHSSATHWLGIGRAVSSTQAQLVLLYNQQKRAVPGTVAYVGPAASLQLGVGAGSINATSASIGGQTTQRASVLVNVASGLTEGHAVGVNMLNTGSFTIDAEL